MSGVFDPDLTPMESFLVILANILIPLCVGATAFIVGWILG